MLEKEHRKLVELKNDNKGSAVGFILGIFILIIIAFNLLPSLAYQATLTRANTSVLLFGGVAALIGILVLLFIILPIIIVAKTL